MNPGATHLKLRRRIAFCLSTIPRETWALRRLLSTCPRIMNRGPPRRWLVIDDFPISIISIFRPVFSSQRVYRKIPPSFTHAREASLINIYSKSDSLFDSREYSLTVDSLFDSLFGQCHLPSHCEYLRLVVRRWGPILVPGWPSNAPGRLYSTCASPLRRNRQRSWRVSRSRGQRTSFEKWEPAIFLWPSLP